MQLHMPSHTYLTRHTSVNATHAELWEYLCNTPGVLSWHKEMPYDDSEALLVRELRKNGNRDYQADYLDVFVTEDGDPDDHAGSDPGEVY